MPAESLVVRIEKEPVALYQLLKLANLVQSGGEAKYAISRGDVRLNGAIETRKRKKVVSGDRITFAGNVCQVEIQRRERS